MKIHILIQNDFIEYEEDFDKIIAIYQDKIKAKIALEYYISKPQPQFRTRTYRLEEWSTK